jgi:hypothetical protein
MAKKEIASPAQNIAETGMPRAEMIWWGLLGLTVLAGIVLMVIAVTIGRV